MRVYLKKEKMWAEVDTKHLFHNQYNLIGIEKRVFDRDIERIEGDIRGNLGRCKYCGKIIERGHEEEHFVEEESKKCFDCLWHRDRLVKEENKPVSIEQETLEDGSIRTIRKIESIKSYEKVCAYKPDYGVCTNKEHRKFGIDWFTPENTFFLKYPNGVPDFAIFGNSVRRTSDEYKSALEYRSFVEFSPRWYKYKYMIGTYTLWVDTKRNENNEIESITGFEINNSRKRIYFVPNNGMFIVKNSFSYDVVKKLDIPDKAHRHLDMILKGLVE